MIRSTAGIELDGSCTALTIGKTRIPIIGFNYSDNLEIEWVYVMGNQVPVAQTPGQYKPGDGTLKVRSTVARELLFPKLPQFGAGNAIMQGVVSFAHPNIGDDSDLLEDMRILGSSLSLEASSKGHEIELQVKYRLIKWGNARVCFGNPEGTGTNGVLKL